MSELQVGTERGECDEVEMASTISSMAVTLEMLQMALEYQRKYLLYKK